MLMVDLKRLFSSFPIIYLTSLHIDSAIGCLYLCRWVHALCQGLTTEDEVEVAADEGFDCSLCKTHNRGSYGKQRTHSAAGADGSTEQPCHHPAPTNSGVCVCEFQGERKGLILLTWLRSSPGSENQVSLTVLSDDVPH